MRTSLNEIQLIDAYLEDKFSDKEKAAFEIRLQQEESLRLHIFLQKKLMGMLRLFHFKERKRVVRQFHNQLFANPAKQEYCSKILNLFQ